MKRFANMNNVARLAITAGIAMVGIALLSPSSSRSATAQQSGSRETTRPFSLRSTEIQLIENGVRFSITAPKSWERFRVAAGKHPRGPISLNRNALSDGQDAEAIIYWTSFPGGQYADPCADLLAPSIGRSAAALAAAVASAPGAKLVKGPSNVTLGGHAAKHVVLEVGENVGCDPGFFYGWANYRYGGAFWHMNTGDTIRVWIVSVDGRRLFIAAATAVQVGWLDKEIQRIVESIRFG